MGLETLAAIGGAAGGEALGSTALGGSLLGPLTAAINETPLLTGMGTGGLLGGGVTTQGIGRVLGGVAGAGTGATLGGLLGGNAQAANLPPPPAFPQKPPVMTAAGAPGTIVSSANALRNPPMDLNTILALKKLGLG